MFFYPFLFLTIVAGVVAGEEFTISDTNPTNEGCIPSSSLTGHLEATDLFLSTLLALVRNARSKAQETESNTSKLPELKHSSPLANCYEIKQRNSSSSSGIYKVRPRYLNHTVSVYCDMVTDNGGWTVFQRRVENVNQQEDFFRNWLDYKEGFGSLAKEFWLGNDVISELSKEEENVLRIDLEDFEGRKRYALYNTFRLSREVTKYQLHVSGFEGDGGDSMKQHNGQFFSTKDSGKTQCAQDYKGGWWYDKCHASNLNGLYLRGNHTSYADGIEWSSWTGAHYSLKKTEMKMRPK